MSYIDIVTAFDPNKKWHPNRIDQEYVANSLPFIDYMNEDLSDLPTATSEGWVDPDNDFRIGLSGGFILDNSFMFINTDQFSKSGIYKEKHGVYCDEEPNSIAYKTYIATETTRRRKGLTLKCKLYKRDLLAYLQASNSKEASIYLHDLRITGDHYTYLNYGRIARTKTEFEKITDEVKGIYGKLTTAFPRFWDGDYLNYKVDEFVVRNEYNLCKAKARSKGYSYKEASNLANMVNLNPNVRVKIGAYDISTYLTDEGATSSMIKDNLNWFEAETYYRRGYVSEDMTNLILGHRTSTGGFVKKGWLSTVSSVSLYNNPNAMVGGKRPIIIVYEEAGICPNLTESLDVTLSSTEVGAGKVGTIKVFGTGGTKAANWEPFKKVFYGPGTYNMIPMENVWDDASRASICGYFHPQVLNLEPNMDQWGNSLLMSAYYYDFEDKKKKGNDPATTTTSYTTYCAQRANKPAEAFGNTKENLFSSIELEKHYKNHIAMPSKDYEDGMYVEDTAGNYKWMSNKELKANGVETHEFIEDYPFKGKDYKGCVRRFAKPIKYNDIVPNDLYDAVYDPLGKDLDSKELTSNHSLDCVIICAYPNVRYPVSDRIVAMYLGRRIGDEAMRIIAAMIEDYNCKILGETDRGDLIPGFRRLGKLAKLHRDPTNYLKDRSKMVNAPYGINMGGGRGDKIVEAYLELKKWLYLPIGITGGEVTRYVFHTITDMGILKELVNFSINSGNYDRLSALRLWTMLRRVYVMKKRDEAKRPINNRQVTLIDELNLR